MRKLALALCAATALAGVNATSHPAMAGPGLAGAVPSLPDSGIEEAQYRWHGRSYCFYPNGWQGPGWYRCGWQRRRGMGWGGPMGWRGWEAPGRGMHRERPRDRDMDRGRERAPQRDMERAPERGATPGGTERRPPAGGERGAAPAGERGAAPGARPAPGGDRGSAPGGERRTEPSGGGERPRDVRPPAGAPGGGGGGGGASPGPN